MLPLILLLSPLPLDLLLSHLVVEVKVEVVAAWGDKKTGSGHVADKCWSKHGKLDWAKSPSNVSNTAPLLPTPSPIDSSAANNTVTLSQADFESLMKLAHGDLSSPLTSMACFSTYVFPSTWLIDSGPPIT